MLTDSGYQQTLKIFEKKSPVKSYVGLTDNADFSTKGQPEVKCGELTEKLPMLSIVALCTFFNMHFWMHLRCTFDKIECTLDIKWINFSIKLDKSGYESGAGGRDTEVL